MTSLMVGHFPHRLDLQSQHEAILRRDVERHARDLFNSCFRSVDRPDKQVGPRTDDPDWSPVVETSIVRLGKARALRVIHRTWYEPGHESIVGRLLVPVAKGMFEFRFDPSPLAKTGRREAAALTRLLHDSAGTNLDDLSTKIDQRAADDPSLDAAFPDHPLTLARNELDELVERGGIEVTEPSREDDVEESEVVEADFAIEPPPRFLRMKADKPSNKRASWSRVSFSGTDGIELLTVSRTGTRLSEPNGRSLSRIAEAITKQTVPAGASSVQVSARALKSKPGRAEAETYRAHVEGNSKQHSLFRWFTEENKEVVMVALGASQCVPMDELEDDAAAVVQSFRRLGAATSSTSEKKKWWQWLVAGGK
ncbi:MAG: hypothetical protein IPM54_38765 [Polyangiaceae bacterium]|nr:hypothetical protein [Polyangiaceae bacterium]